MISKVLAWTAVAALSLTQVSLSRSHRLCDGFVEENNMNIPVSALHAFGATGGIDEATFNRVLDRVEKIYTPIIAAAGGKLNIVRNWTDGTVNAYAVQEGTDWQIQMFGGLARHPVITEDAMAAVTCHEMGHHLGGAPKIPDPTSTWASNEGQADYFAALKCLRLYFDPASNAQWMKETAASIPQFAISKCTEVYSSENDKTVCLRTAMATYSVGLLFQDLRQETVVPQFNTPDKSIVSVMDDNHPGTQCRVDTYFESALCNQPVSAALSNTDYSVGTCTQAAGYKNGYRPRCWFKP